MQIEVTPALEMHAMFTEVVAMAHGGRMNRRGLPRNLRDLATLAHRYADEAHAPGLTARPAAVAHGAAGPPSSRRAARARERTASRSSSFASVRSGIRIRRFSLSRSRWRSMKSQYSAVTGHASSPVRRVGLVPAAGAEVVIRSM